MYSFFDGIVEEIDSDSVIINVNNIGFKIFVPNPYSYELSNKYRIYVYNHIREDDYSLYGFKIKEERDLFRKFIDVKGMGPKVASGIFATGSISGVVDAINRENILYLTKFPKIGDKLARQIILDLKGKVVIEDKNIVESNDELISVLENLGYKNNDIKKVIGSVDTSKSLEEQVKDSLKLLLK